MGGERKIREWRIGTVFLSGHEARQRCHGRAEIRLYGVYDRLLRSDMIVEEQKAPFKSGEGNAYRHSCESSDSSKIGRKTRTRRMRKFGQEKDAAEDEIDLHSCLKNDTSDAMTGGGSG